MSGTQPPDNRQCQNLPVEVTAATPAFIPDQILAKAREVAEALARNAPLSMQAIKEVECGIEGLSVRDAFEAVQEGRFPAYKRMLVSEDHAEGPRAFTEKRDPDLTARSAQRLPGLVLVRSGGEPPPWSGGIS